MSCRRGSLKLALACVCVLAAVAPAVGQSRSSLADLIQAGNRKAALDRIRTGADVDDAQPDGTRAIHWAVYKVDYELIDALIAKKAKVDVVNEFGATPLAEAVKLAEAGPVDIAFLDVDLKAAKSGLDFLKWLRAQDRDTRAIMLSGNAGKELVMTCLAEGASGYIVKDMESDGLFRRALDTVFSGSIFLPATVIGRGGFSPALPAAPTAGR